MYVDSPDTTYDAWAAAFASALFARYGVRLRPEYPKIQRNGPQRNSVRAKYLKAMAKDRANARKEKGRAA